MRIFRFSVVALVGITFIVLFTNFSKKQPYLCKRENSNVQINESSIIWGGEYHFDIKSQMHYSLTYDDHYLYVGMKTSDEALKHKIMEAGLTFWIDTNARGKEKLGLMFPLQHKPDPGRKRNMNMDSQKRKSDSKNTSEEIKKFNARYLNNLELMDIIGFGGETELSTSGNINKNGISAILHTDTTDFMYYFAFIPLELIFNNPDNYLNNSTNQFSFSFKTNELERPSNAMGSGRPSMGEGGPSGGGGRPQGGGPPNGGGTPPDNVQMQEIEKPSVLTVKKAILSADK